MKKIVIDARGYRTTTGRYVRKLIEKLEQLEADQTEREYIVLLFPDEFELYSPKNTNFSKLVANYKHYGFAEQFGFLSLLNKLKPDLVHFTMPQQPIFYKGKVITTVHDLTLLKVFPGNRNRLAYKLKQQIGSFVFRRIAKKSNKIITPSKYTKSEYIKFLNPSSRTVLDDKILVTYESADSIDSKPVPYNSLVGQEYIMYVGQQSNYKNLRNLILAHQKLLSDDKNLRLVLVGKQGQYGQQTKKWVEQQSFKNIVYTGYVEEAKLAWLYQNCRAYVFPSLMEGFGLPGLEAMANGTPVVSSNATSLPEVYGDAAHYFNPEDIEDIKNAIKQVLEDKELRGKLIKNGKQQLKKYSWDKMTNQTLELYINTLKTP